MIKYICLGAVVLTFLTSCEPPPTENIKIIDGHVYIWKKGIHSQYLHDSQCPACQELNQKLTTEQLRKK